jgi:hypothetical protein
LDLGAMIGVEAMYASTSFSASIISVASFGTLARRLSAT